MRPRILLAHCSRVWPVCMAHHNKLGPKKSKKKPLLRGIRTADLSAHLQVGILDMASSFIQTHLCRWAGNYTTPVLLQQVMLEPRQTWVCCLAGTPYCCIRAHRFLWSRGEGVVFVCQVSYYSPYPGFWTVHARRFPRFKSRPA